MPALTFHLIPHTHWDREWYLTRAGFQARLVPMLDDLLEQIQGFVREGRLQVGPWYVLADELIPSGESLVRNLLVGQADAARLGGRTDVLYSPDAFGHPATWPQLAGEFGIHFGVIWRGLGGEAGHH